MNDIGFKIEDRVARITLARPPLNVLNIAMMREITAALGEAGQREVVAIVFDADKNCRAFSAGVAIEEHVEETIYQMLDAFHAIFRQLEQIGKPAIALVDGAALGGGCELVAACDIVIASDRSRFGQPEIKLGVFPPVASFFFLRRRARMTARFRSRQASNRAVLLPRVIGEKRARELILTGEIIDATEASRLGLCNHVAPPAHLETKLLEVLSKLKEVSGTSLQFARQALDLGHDGVGLALVPERKHAAAREVDEHLEAALLQLDEMQPLLALRFVGTPHCQRRGPEGALLPGKFLALHEVEHRDEQARNLGVGGAVGCLEHHRQQAGDELGESCSGLCGREFERADASA